jgi:predicted regulator of Ras-like GTPase activity (Roadblock/LC7/MglB family)
MNNYKDNIKDLMSLSGALCAAVVDYDSGMTLASVGGGIDLEIAAAGNTEVVRSKMRTMELLKTQDEIEDILITLGKQYHLLRPIKKEKGLFLYFVLDRGRANLALARRMLLQVEGEA